MKNTLKLFALLLLLSCSPEEPCEEQSFGTVCFINNTAGSIDYSVNGNRIGVIESTDERCRNFDSGDISISGFDSDGFTWNNSIFIANCETREFSFIR